VTVDVVPDATQVYPGGTLGYTVTLANTTAQSRSFFGSITAVMPDAARIRVRGPLPVTLGAGAVRTVHLSEFVPGATPLGKYSLKVSVGTTAENVWDVGGFGFEVK